MMLASLWFALFAQWMTVVPIILPHQVAAIVGDGHPQRDGIVGSVVAAGAVVALLVAPLAGALSDAHRSARGRRRAFLITGAAGSMLGLLSLLWYTLAFLNLQFWWNWVAGAYAGLVPDVEPPQHRGTASGWLNVMSVLGTIAGNGLLAVLYAPGRLGATVVVFVLLTCCGLWLTLSAAREPDSRTTAPPFAWRRFMATLFVSPSEHPAFYWVLVSRLLANMGVWSIFTFLLFYLGEVVGAEQPAQLLTLLLGAGALLSVPASLYGIHLARRLGNVAVARASSWIMAAAALGYVLIALRPAVGWVAPVVLVFAAAYGAYQAVDWALALQVLPDLENAGKDMGVWHISMVLPQVIGPAATGWLISGLKQAYSAQLAYTTAFALAAAWFVLAAWLVGRVRLPDSGRHRTGTTP
jgi:Na+/melibiose symporter-like transporter